MGRLRESLTIASICALSAVGAGVAASSDFYSVNNGNGAPYSFSEIRSVDFPPDDENDSTTAAPASSPSSSAARSSSRQAESVATPSIVASSLLYEGGCVVSSQAIMCNGGGGGGASGNTQRSRSSAASAAPDGDSFLRHLLDDDTFRELLGQDFWDDEEDDEREDGDGDDDDQDDGHSSMLSNASVRRSSVNRASARAYANGGGSTVARSAPSHGMERTTYLEGEVRLQKQGPPRRHSPHPRSTAFSVASAMRGGAASSELSQKLINSAIVTLVFEALIGHILEFFKIVMQTSPPGTTYASVYKDITSEKGIGGLWDGFIPWGVVQAVLKGGIFGLAYALAVRALKPLAAEGKMPMKLAMTLAGGIAGGFQGYVLSPTLLMKTRVMTNEVFRESMTVMQTTWKSLVIGGDIIKTEGLGSLMKGSNTFATKRVFDWATRYYFADLFEALFVNLKGSPLNVTEKIVASLLGGIASTVLTLPLDVLVAKTQDAKKAGVKVSAWKLFSDQLEKEGWGGLRNNYMKGFEARLAHVCLTTVVMKTIEPIVYDVFFKAKAT